MKFAFFDGAGRVDTACNDDTVDTAPDGAIVLTGEEWVQRFDLRLEGGLLIHDPMVVPVEKVWETAWEKIKAKRDRLRFDGGVLVGGHWFLTTAQATSEYNSLVLIGASLPDHSVLRADWRTMDDTLVDMTPSLARSIIAAGFSQIAAIDDAAQSHKAALKIAADPANYDFSTGWPPVFEV